MPAKICGRCVSASTGWRVAGVLQEGAGPRTPNITLDFER